VNREDSGGHPGWSHRQEEQGGGQSRVALSRGGWSNGGIGEHVRKSRGEKREEKRGPSKKKKQVKKERRFRPQAKGSSLLTRRKVTLHGWRKRNLEKKQKREEERERSQAIPGAIENKDEGQNMYAGKQYERPFGYQLHWAGEGLSNKEKGKKSSKKKATYAAPRRP